MVDAVDDTDVTALPEAVGFIKMLQMRLGMNDTGNMCSNDLVVSLYGLFHQLVPDFLFNSIMRHKVIKNIFIL